MIEAEKRLLAEAWIAFSHANRDAVADDADFSAWEQMTDLCLEAPDIAWDVILLILATDQSIATMETLSAGPLEDLLGRHGLLFIDRVEAEARADPKFASLLGGVWKNAMTDAIWERVRRVWDRRGWDGTPPP